MQTQSSPLVGVGKAASGVHESTCLPAFLSLFLFFPAPQNVLRMSPHLERIALRESHANDEIH